MENRVVYLRIVLDGLDTVYRGPMNLDEAVDLAWTKAGFGDFVKRLVAEYDEPESGEIAAVWSWIEDRRRHRRWARIQL